MSSAEWSKKNAVDQLKKLIMMIENGQCQPSELPAKLQEVKDKTMAQPIQPNASVAIQQQRGGNNGTTTTTTTSNRGNNSNNGNNSNRESRERQNTYNALSQTTQINSNMNLNQPQTTQSFARQGIPEITPTSTSGDATEIEPTNTNTANYGRDETLNKLPNSGNASSSADMRQTLQSQVTQPTSNVTTVRGQEGGSKNGLGCGCGGDAKHVLAQNYQKCKLKYLNLKNNMYGGARCPMICKDGVKVPDYKPQCPWKCGPECPPKPPCVVGVGPVVAVPVPAAPMGALVQPIMSRRNP